MLLIFNITFVNWGDLHMIAASKKCILQMIQQDRKNLAISNCLMIWKACKISILDLTENLECGFKKKILFLIFIPYSRDELTIFNFKVWLMHVCR